MRIGVVAPAYGVPVPDETLRELARRGHQVHLFAPPGSTVPEGVRLHYTRGPHGDDAAEAEREIWDWHRGLLASCDLVHDCTVTCAVFERCWIAGEPAAVCDRTPRLPAALPDRRQADLNDPDALLAAYHEALSSPWGIGPGGHVDRLAWQRNCCARVDGPILNVGCKEDPAGLKARWPDRVTDLDAADHDSDLLRERGVRVPIQVDVRWDVRDLPWPFGDAAFDLVVLAEVLEELPPGVQPRVLAEAGRVGRHLCVTSPEDGPERDPHHLTRITRGTIEGWLREAGWRPLDLHVAPYPHGLHGYFVFAERR